MMTQGTWQREQGPPGAGVLWHFGRGAPPDPPPWPEGHIYLDHASGDVWRVIAVAAGLEWTREPGPPGPPGTGWHFGHGDPPVDADWPIGDVYVDLDNGDLWRAVPGVRGELTWARETRLPGPPGPPGIEWHFGRGDPPDDADWPVGDAYLDLDTLNAWRILPPGPDDLDPRLPLPPWAPRTDTWRTLVSRLRTWLCHDNACVSDNVLQQLSLMSESFLHTVRQGWLWKIRCCYSDPNRLIRAQIGSESMQWPTADDLIRWARGVIDDLDAMLRGRSRVMGYGNDVWHGARLYGITDYMLAPPPIAYYGPGRVPSAWDVTRFPPMHWVSRSPWPRVWVG